MQDLDQNHNPHHTADDGFAIETGTHPGSNFMLVRNGVPSINSIDRFLVEDRSGLVQRRNH